MENVQPGSSSPATPVRGGPFFLIGILLFVLGPALYAVALQWGDLQMPWYLPILATLGVFCMVYSVSQRRIVWRKIVLTLFFALCVFEWFFILMVAKTPLYTGPGQPGEKIPAFATTLADGTSFTNQNLEDGKRTVLLFFRGRW